LSGKEGQAMKKEEIITAFIVLAIIIAELLSQKFTRNVAKEMEDKMENINNEILAIVDEKNKGKEQEISQRTKELYDEWEKKTDTLAFYIDHSELEKINVQLNKVIGYLEIGMPDEATVEMKEGIFKMEHIKLKQQLCLKNIF